MKAGGSLPLKQVAVVRPGSSRVCYLPTVSVLGDPEVGKTVKGTSRELRNSRASVQGSGSCRSVREHHELPGHLGGWG